MATMIVFFAQRIKFNLTLYYAKSTGTYSAFFICFVPSLFPAGAFEGNARRLSRVVASTEFGLPNSLVRGNAPNTPCFNGTRFYLYVMVSNPTAVIQNDSRYLESSV